MRIAMLAFELLAFDVLDADDQRHTLAVHSLSAALLR